MTVSPDDVSPSDGRRRPAAARLASRAMRRRTVAVIAQGLAVLLPTLAAAQQPGPPIPLIPPAPSLSEKPGPPPTNPEPPITSEPLALNAAIGGLERVGLDSDARRLAVEAALAAGL